MKTIGIKLADGTFYPILEEGAPKRRILDLTTATDNQTKVQVDLYRSESGTMADAEYVDTLEVSKLNPHSVDETELHLSVGLDENNELSAEVVDPETGRKSETQVKLITRTAEERQAPADFSVSKPAIEEPQAEETAIDDSMFDEPTVTDVSSEFLDEPSTDAEAFDTSTLEETPSFDEPTVEATEFEEKMFDDIPDSTQSTEQTESPVQEDSKLDEPFSFDDIPDFDETPLESSVSEEPTKSVSDDFELPDFDETPLEPSVSEEPTKSASDDFELPDFDETPLEPSVSKDSEEIPESSEMPDFSDIDFDNADSDTTKSSDLNLDDNFSFDTPETKSESDNIFDLPDFDDLEKSSTNSSASTDTDFDDLFNDSPSDTAASSSPLDFSGLYDKETINGEHATVYSNYDDDDEEEKKSKLPVILCILCALICIIATILILFVIPSKYNLIKKTSESKETTKIEKTEKEIKIQPKTPAPVVEQPAQKNEETTIQIPVPEQPKPVEEKKPEPPAAEVVAPQAQENKIVIIPEEAVEKTVPVVKDAPVEKKSIPEASVKKNTNTKDVKYTIKWGDTLWDISDSYYKTPWKYLRIADYNQIRNPDIIISGTDILLPAE